MMLHQQSSSSTPVRQKNEKKPLMWMQDFDEAVKSEQVCNFQDSRSLSIVEVDKYLKMP